jgi:hypothetical protein
MSAPQTNVERQARRHWGPLLGITAGLVFVGVILLGVFYWTGEDAATQPSDVEGVPATTEPAAPGSAPAAP